MEKTLLLKIHHANQSKSEALEEQTKLYQSKLHLVELQVQKMEEVFVIGEFILESNWKVNV
jgi:hypothetical protein